MSTSTFTLDLSNASTALFRAWGAALHAAIVACGWTNTSDTGQIDFTTTTPPGTTNTKQGYKIYASAGNKFYLRVDYGSGIGTGVPGVWFRFGTGTDGAGTLTGNLSYEMRYNHVTNASDGVRSHYVSGDGDWLAIVLSPNTGAYATTATGNGLVMTAGKSRNSAGVVTDDYLSIVYCGYDPSVANNSDRKCWQHSVLFRPSTGTVWPDVSYMSWGLCSNFPNGRDNGSPASLSGSGPRGFGAYPIFPYPAGPVDYYALNGMLYGLDDAQAGTTFTVSVFGVDRLYLCPGNIWQGQPAYAGPCHTFRKLGVAIPWH